MNGNLRMSCILNGILPLQSQNKDKKERSLYQINSLETSQTQTFLKPSGGNMYHRFDTK